MWENSMNTPSDLFIAKQPNIRPFQYPKKNQEKKAKQGKETTQKKILKKKVNK